MKFLTTPYNDSIVLIGPSEQELRIDRIRRLMGESNIDAIIITNHANIYYLTGRVFDGYIFIPVSGEIVYFVRRPVNLEGGKIVNIRKPEDIASHITSIPTTLGLEYDLIPFSTVIRLQNLFPQATPTNASAIMRTARSIKTATEIELIKRSGIEHVNVHRQIPQLYQPGMTDIDLQIEIEYLLRKHGCLGQFRISGDSMELYMGNLLVGDNADAPSPYDFAMGGAGMTPSLPVGAAGTPIKPGNTIMIDMNGNFTGHMTDMTRTYACGPIADIAVKAHNCSIDIHHALVKAAVPGVKCSDLYNLALTMAGDAGLAQYFMGHRQHAGFIGHGIGIEVNELPVIAPRSRDVISCNMVIAIEPKFVIPAVGAVGIENTYLATLTGLVNLTELDEQIIQL